MAAKPRPCERCKAMIPVERLETLPETRLCLKCSQEVGSEFHREVVTKGLSKGGIKITGTDIVGIRKKRKRLEP